MNPGLSLTRALWVWHAEERSAEASVAHEFASSDSREEACDASAAVEARSVQRCARRAVSADACASVCRVASLRTEAQPGVQVVSRSDPAEDGYMNWLTWALLSALFAGASSILAKVGVAGVHSHLATAIRTAVVLVLSWTIALWTVSPRSVLSLDARTWLFLVLSGGATSLSWLCYFRALQIGSATNVASIDKLSVAFVVVFAVVFLNEALTWRMTLGVGCIVIGAILLASS